MSLSPGFDLTNVLLGLAWLGELDRRQIKRLWFVDKSMSTVEKTLAKLHKDELLAKRTWSIRDEERGVTVPQLARWSLTPKGHALVKASDQYPAKPAQARQQRLMAHDVRTTETIVRLIEIGRRSMLSGLFVAHELRLDPQEKRPICDALVVMQFGSFDQPNLVPWSSDPAIEDESRFRFAIEADNDTEPLGVIAGKARAYRRLDEDDAWAAWWTRQHGPTPIPLWVVPSEERATAVHNQWKRAWPDGYWLITTDAGLQRNELRNWHQRAEKTVMLEFHRRRPKLEAAPQAPSQQPQLPVPTVPPPATIAPVSPETAAQPTGSSDVPPAGNSTPPPEVIAPGQAAQPAPVPSLPLAAVALALPPLPTAADYELFRKRYPAPNPWLELCSSLLAWSGLMLWAALCWSARLLWATLKLPWRAIIATVRWHTELDDEVTATIWRVVLAAVLVVGPLYVWLAQPAWLLNPLRAALPPIGLSVEEVSTTSPVTEHTPPAPVCPAAHVTARQVNLRAGPGREERVLRKLRLGEQLAVLDCRNYQEDGYIWWQVVGEDSVEGWAATNWLEEVK